MKHCDDYIEDAAHPECLSKFIEYARSPAHGANRPEPRPSLFADFEGRPVRVTMASRFGDVGITSKLQQERGYEQRVYVADLTNFRENPGETS